MNGLSIIKVFLDSLSILINDNKNLLGLSHLVHKCVSEVLKNLWINLTVHERILQETGGHNVEIHTLDVLPKRGVSVEEALFCFLEDVHREEMPEFQADFEELVFWDV